MKTGLYDKITFGTPTALLREHPTDKSLYVAQFDNKNLFKEGQHGISLFCCPTIKIEESGIAIEKCLGYGWHEFKKTDFVNVK